MGGIQLRHFFTTNQTEFAFYIQSLTVLRRRVDGSIPCSFLIFDYSKNIVKNIGLGLNCTSIYQGKIHKTFVRGKGSKHSHRHEHMHTHKYGEGCPPAEVGVHSAGGEGCFPQD